jgi:LuxR family maltose regulon positive regulatory protein
VAELHRRTATWLAEQGLVDEALRHALAIDDLNLATELMVAGLCDALNRDDRSTLDRWLNTLPDDVVERHPWLLMIKALVFGTSWQLAALENVLGQIEALLGEDGEVMPYTGNLPDLPVLRGMLASLRAQQAFRNHQPDRAIAYAEDALALLPKRWSFARGGTILYWGLAMQATGQGDVAHRTLMDEYESLLEKSDAYSLRILFTTSFNSIEAGDLEQAKVLALALLERASSHQLKLTTGHGHYLLGVLHYCRNELDAAQQHFEEIVTNRFAVYTQVARNAMIGLARVYSAKNEVSAAWQMLDLLSQLDMSRLGESAEDARSLRALMEYRHGDAELAFRWADGFTAPVTGSSLLWLQDPHLMKARILLERGTDADVRAVLEILDALQSFAERTFNVRSQIETLTLRAVALEKQGKTVEALTSLKRAVELARPGGVIRVFVDLGLPMQTMLQDLVREGFAAPTVERILTAFPQHSPETTKASDPDIGWSRMRVTNSMLIEPLTNRELEVLSLLRHRLSNKEIGQKLSLSPLTVKRYTNQVYGKLGVNRRWDAVIRAEELGLFPPS